MLDDLGLIPAIRSYLSRYSDHHQIDVLFDCMLNRRLTVHQETVVYRIIQEALTNIQKYAQTSKANVAIREMEDVVRLMIEDRGKGFQMSATSRGVGLFSMEERARAIGGTLKIHSALDKETTIIVELPFNENEK